MDTFKYNIAQAVSESLVIPLAEVEKVVEIPPEEHMGDYSVPCFRFSQTLKQPPHRIAENIVSNIKPLDFIEDIKVSGGYVNFFLDREVFISRAMDEIERDGFGRSEKGRDKTVVIDFSSPNIAKPFSVGHLRSTVIGNSLARIYTYLGYNVIRINHLGDWGTQFGKLMVAFQKWGKEELLYSDDPVKYLVELYIRFHEEAEKDPSIEEIARSKFKSLENGERESFLLWEKFKAISLNEFQKVYDILGVRFDEVLGESFYNDKADKFLKHIISLGLTRESQGALIVDLERVGMPPVLLKKSDQATLYATRDLACAVYRYERYKFDKMLYVVGQDQRLHFRQIFQVLKVMGYQWADECTHVDFGMIRFKGEKMSTRRGKVVLLEDVLELSHRYVHIIMKDRDIPEDKKNNIAKDIGIAAVVFSDLKNKRVKDIDFDIERALSYDTQTQSFKGESGPYLQYIHARVCSVLKKYGKDPDTNSSMRFLKDAEEFRILKFLYRYPDVIEDAANSNEPSILADYLLYMASLFSTYYQDKEKHRIVSDDESLSAARIRMCLSLKKVLSGGLYLLGINAPEEM